MRVNEWIQVVFFSYLMRHRRLRVTAFSFMAITIV
jgi:hypothetical protein